MTNKMDSRHFLIAYSRWGCSSPTSPLLCKRYWDGIGKGAFCCTLKLAAEAVTKRNHCLCERESQHGRTRHTRHQHCWVTMSRWHAILGLRRHYAGIICARAKAPQWGGLRSWSTAWYGGNRDASCLVASAITKQNPPKERREFSKVSSL